MYTALWKFVTEFEKEILKEKKWHFPLLPWVESADKKVKPTIPASLNCFWCRGLINQSPSHTHSCFNSFIYLFVKCTFQAM